MGDLTAFEEKLFDSLKKLIGPEEFGRTKVLGAAVSGGADSVSLLCALAKIKESFEGGSKKELPEAGQKAKGRQFFPKIVCVTVDHSIRPEEESSGDAAFVKSLCQKLGVECAVKKIERGAVERLAAQRGKGVEEAARFLRYQKFEGFAKESGAQFICLAHNQNDALETLLMRFLQGSSAAYGIAARRENYLRPLLDFSREQIEEYLRSQKVDWRTDATNSDNKYFRNKARNLLIPFLDQNFEGWKKALLAGGEKALFEDGAVEAFLEDRLLAAGKSPDFFGEEDGEALSFCADFFKSLPIALRQRLLYRAAGKLGLEERLPYSFVRTVSFWPEKDFKKTLAAGLEASSKKDKVFLKKTKKEATESGFFDIIVGKNGAESSYVLRSRAVGDEL